MEEDYWSASKKFRSRRGTLDQRLYSTRCLRGLWSLPNQSTCVCGSGEGIRPCPLCILWGMLREYGVWGPFAKGCSVSVRPPEQELGSALPADLQHVLGGLQAECKVAGMRISTSKSEAMVLDRKRVACPLQGPGLLRTDHTLCSRPSLWLCRPLIVISPQPVHSA
ncbi:hypothetical protein L3Q82_012328 [Scortum barcoo]|uniref:Uncharacterized protein n=1 Tax=Scortum barcoo TaxID=214431 RepID=A0ACB8W1V3_9TELE|nr:hypothetical protein L3Q82_012328 [Scortum barcoo]